jgi:succinate dehydrogenase / fumarate reductase flavoprotein subunit
MSHEVDTINADVLIIGGGFAGTWAALHASQYTDSVVLVDKAYVSRSGASTMSGGVTTCPFEGEDLSLWAKEFVTHGSYMCNYDWTMAILEGQVDRIKQYAAWGVPISRDDQGNIKRFSSRGMVDVRCMQYAPKKAMEALRRQVLARGVRILDRVFVTELITSDGKYPTEGQVCGAFGFYTRQSGCVAIVAKRTIVATGPMAMKGRHHIDNDTGDGFAMGYRAGARLVDLEFSYGGTFSVLMKNLPLGNYNVAVAHGARLINVKGERFMEKYDPVRLERSELSRVIAAFTKEVEEGRGPVYVDFRHSDADYWTSLVQVGKKQSILLSGHIPDPKTTPLPIEPTWGLWNGSRSGLKINLQAETTVAGLLGAGVCTKNEATGTHSSAGIPTAYAKNTGHIAGGTAGRQAREVAPPELSKDILQMLAEQATAPLRRHSNEWTPDRLHTELARIEASIVDQMHFNADKLERKVKQCQDISDAAARTGAENLHELCKLHEAASIAENARLVYMSSADRTESRESFYREDYPKIDNSQWFCFHGVRRTPNGAVFDREPIPVERMPFPAVIEQDGKVSPIHAIFTDSYDPENYS